MAFEMPDICPPWRNAWLNSMRPRKGGQSRWLISNGVSIDARGGGFPKTFGGTMADRSGKPKGAILIQTLGSEFEFR